MLFLISEVFQILLLSSDIDTVNFDILITLPLRPCVICRSAGFTSEGPTTVNMSTRQVTCPPGETNINDVALNSTGSVLYSAAGNTVRLWDIRK